MVQSRPDIAHCLQCRWNIDDSEGRILGAAWDAYLNHPDEYDQILGDFIPAKFRDKLRAQVSENRFDRNTNLTAADDWPVYRSRLQDGAARNCLVCPPGYRHLILPFAGFVA